MTSPKSVDFQLSEADHPFLKIELMNLLADIHETILLDKVNMNREIRANGAKVCLEMLLEQLHQKCGKMKWCW